MKKLPIVGRISGAWQALRGKAAASLSPVWSTLGGPWFNLIREPFSGAWQQNVAYQSRENVLRFSGVFACVTGISSDVAKLRPRLMEYDEEDEIWVPVEEPNDVSSFLKKPNRYQNWIQFAAQWIICKLLNGNVYVLKVMGLGGKVVGAYILDPCKVRVMVAPDGSIYYELSADNLSQLPESKILAPASAIIHDRMNCLWHPLVGVSPLYACCVSASLGNRIQNNSLNFFGNASRPSGMLSAPGEISQTTADRLKAAWEENFSGSNIGRLAVLGDGLKYESMTIPATDAQLVEQLKWTVEDVARAYHYPMHKLGGTAPSYNNLEALEQAYYNDCLQILIESMEAGLGEGFALPDGRCIDLDLNGLLRMDSISRYERHNKAIAGGWLAPNQARRMENMRPVAGGDSPMMQQQNWSLEQLASRKAPTDSAGVAPPPPTPSASSAAERSADDLRLLEELTSAVVSGIEHEAETEAN